jgi:glycosyltransferase involved in cell wall biosynthesis
MTPKVSICIPTYNRASVLRQTIEAILGQTFVDWEMIVSDDASLDNTGEVVASFGDKRIRYYRNEKNLGLYPNWHRCMELAMGEYIAIYHDHDLYLPTIVERSVEMLDRYSTASFVHTALLMIDEHNVPVRVVIHAFPELMLGSQMRYLLASSWHSPVTAAIAMVRQEAYARVGRYDYTRYGLGCDLNMWFRLAGVGDVAYVNEPQAFIRARQKGDMTALFRWSELVGRLRMRRDHQELMLSAGCQGFYSRARYILERDMLLLRFMTRAILLESPTVVDEGIEIIQAEASLWVRLVSAAVRKSMILQGLLRRSVLQLHYRKVSRWLENREQEAADYVKANTHLQFILRRQVGDRSVEYA